MYNAMKMAFMDWNIEREYDFTDDIEMYKCILIANNRKETLNIQLKVKEKTFYLTNWDLFFITSR